MTLLLPESVPAEFKEESFLEGIRSAKITLGSVETGLSAQSEFELYFQTGAKQLDLDVLYKRARNVDIRHSKIRSAYWKIFLSYVPSDTSAWPQILSIKRQQFDNFKEKYINSVPKNEENLVSDNPLLSTAGGTWDQYFEDTELREKIELDIDRTYPENEFFVNMIVQKSLTNILFVYCKENEWLSYRQGMNELIAALFMVNTVQSTISPYVDDDAQIQSKDNSKSNTTANDNDNDNDNDSHTAETETETETEPHQNSNSDNTGNGHQNNGKKSTQTQSLWEQIQDIRYIEHDTYFMFSEIMSIMGQYFINASGADVPPVVERCQRIQGQLLRQMDTQLGQHLIKVNIMPQLYGLRWIRLFFSRDFHLRDVCVVWDSVFATYSDRKRERDKLQLEYKLHAKKTKANHRRLNLDHSEDKPRKIRLDFRFVDYMSCSMLLFIRHQLLGRDQQHCLRRLMRYPPIEDVSSLIIKAYTIRDHIERRGKFAKNKTRSKYSNSASHLNSKHRSNAQHAINTTFDFTDRWSSFSKTVSSAMNTYAEDVKSLIGGKRRTLKSRMQFENALGNKMDELLSRLQNTVNLRREELSSPTSTSKSIATEETKDNNDESNANVNANDNSTDAMEQNENSDPISSTSAAVNDSSNSTADASTTATTTATTTTDNDSIESYKKSEEVFVDPLSAMLEDSNTHITQDSTKSNPKENNNNNNGNGNVGDDNMTPLLIIEEALAELKLVKDALLGNLDELQLESWLDWKFVEPSPEPVFVSQQTTNANKKVHKSPNPGRNQSSKRQSSVTIKRSKSGANMRKNGSKKRKSLTSSGLPPPKYGSKPTFNI